MKAVKHIDIGSDYSPALGPRYRADGDFSGEAFREEVLEPALDDYETLVIHLDNIETFSASFFEEAFGGLARKHGTSVLGRLLFDTEVRAYLLPKIEAWIREAL